MQKIDIASLLFIPCVFGCTAVMDPPAEVQGAMGTVSLALSTTLPSGVTYRLAGDWWVNLNRDTSFFGQDRIGAAQPTYELELPEGSYAARFFQTTTDATGAVREATTNTLERVNLDGSVQSVKATFLDPNQAFQITPNQTTNVTLGFDVPGLGPLKLSSGQLSVQVAATESTSVGRSGVLKSRGRVASVMRGTLANAPDSLFAISDQEQEVTIRFTFTSPFTIGVRKACASIQAEVTSPEVVTPLVVEFLAINEPTVTGTLCFPEGSSSFSMVLARRGESHSAFRDYLPGDQNFGLSVGGFDPPAPIHYDGRSIDLTAFATERPVSNYMNLGVSTAGIDFALGGTGGSLLIEP